MKLLPGERLLRESQPPVRLALTTHRVRLESQAFGSARITSIMLDQVASCSLSRTSQPIFLVIAALSVFVGLGSTAANSDSNLLPVGVVAGLVFGLIYLAGRKQAIAIASSGETFTARTKGMSVEAVREMIDAVEAAKDARSMLLAEARTSAHGAGTGFDA